MLRLYSSGVGRRLNRRWEHSRMGIYQICDLMVNVSFYSVCDEFFALRHHRVRLFKLC